MFDVLLSMLRDESSCGAMYVQGGATRVYPVQDIAYADDLITISSSLALQQTKTDLVCMFCACTGMQISLAKIGFYAINCDAACSNLVLHDSSWSAHLIAPTTGVFACKYLGFYSDHVNGDCMAFASTLEYLRAASSHLIHCHASREVKLLVYRMQTKACWNLEQCWKIDRYAAAILKHVGRHMATSANSMMFFPSDMCGSGSHAISDLVQAQKWGELVRALDLPGETAWAANGLLEQALRQTAQQAPPTQLRTVDSRHTSHLKGFVGSLVEWGADVGFHLTNAPSYSHHEGNAAILPYLEDGPESEDLIQQLQRKDITVQGELVRHSYTGEMRRETDPTTTLMRRLVRDNLLNSPSDEGILLNCGQMYQFNDQVFEVIGVVVETSTVLCYRWH